jgi:Fe-S-cluster-containing hydrogenase component 2
MPSFPPESPYRRLAGALDALPNRFPPGEDESDLRVLEKLFTLEEAALAAELRLEIETPAQIARRLDRSPVEVMPLLKEMSRKGLIALGKTAEGRPGFGLLPYVVGFYENQGSRIDVDLARRVEDYFLGGFASAMSTQPQVHRVIPVGETIPNTLEVRPYESAQALIDGMQAWAVGTCICRKQMALIGKACGHPLDVCMWFSTTPHAFDGSPGARALTREEAHQELLRAAEAGLVHCVSNNQRDTWYICNCCTCGCGVLRGMAELGLANVVARSAFVNLVDESLCAGCEDCLPACQFGALAVDGTAHINAARCVGCGLCVIACPQGALRLARREGEQEPPVTEADWRMQRLQGRGVN